MWGEQGVELGFMKGDLSILWNLASFVVLILSTNEQLKHVSQQFLL